MDLQAYRQVLNELDDSMAKLVEERFALIAEIARYKKEQGLPVSDRSREEQILQRLCLQHPLYKKEITSLYELIFTLSKDNQKNLMGPAQQLTLFENSPQPLKPIYGLLGRRLNHSHSPFLHSLLGSYPYQLYEKEPAELEIFFKENNIGGLNVTVPYKQTVIKYCHALSDLAAEIKGVNVLMPSAQGGLIGHNTDYYGLAYALAVEDVSLQDKKVIILGSGATGRMAAALVRHQGGHGVIISRSGQNNYENLYLHYDAQIIINATPVGVYPQNQQSPLDLTPFKECHYVFDAIYNPYKTSLLLQAESLNIPCQNGLIMLAAQGLASSKLFLNCEFSDQTVQTLSSKLKERVTNLVLIGMPGSGKSALGSILGKIMGRSFYDSDELIAREIGMSPGEMIIKEGEETFRRLERETLAQIGKVTGSVIATGGGAVLHPDNIKSLKQNGILIYLKRDTDKLAKEGRPLSAGADIATLYAQRKEHYENAAQAQIVNEGDMTQVSRSILEVYYEILASKRP